MMRWIGLDIGGANIKLADTERLAKQVSFPMWRTPDRLHEELARLVDDLPSFDAVALTMTGEMADCFETRELGVCSILEQVTRILPAHAIRVFSVDGRWLTVSQAARSAWQVASSNWKALAQYSTRWSQGTKALLVDIGSTTTDIVAIANNQVLSSSLSDRDRLVTGELVYTGVERSSIVGLVSQIAIHGQICPIINEQFATIGDVNLILGLADEVPHDTDTADGRPKTRASAAYRLARIIGEDGSTLPSQDIESIAEAIYEAQVVRVSQAMEQVAHDFHQGCFDTIIFSGHGDHLIDNAMTRNRWDKVRVKLTTCLGPTISRCAPAHAVAVLAKEALDA